MSSTNNRFDMDREAVLEVRAGIDIIEGFTAVVGYVVNLVFNTFHSFASMIQWLPLAAGEERFCLCNILRSVHSQ